MPTPGSRISMWAFAAPFESLISILPPAGVSFMAFSRTIKRRRPIPRSISVDTLSAARKFLRELDTLGHRQNGTLIFQSFNVWMRSTLLNRSRLHWHRRGPAQHRPQPIYRLRVMVHFRSILVEICEYPPKLFPPVGKRRKNPTGLPPLSAAAIEFSPC
jgi:hypothetical protein